MGKTWGMLSLERCLVAIYHTCRPAREMRGSDLRGLNAIDVGHDMVDDVLLSPFRRDASEESDNFVDVPLDSKGSDSQLTVDIGDLHRHEAFAVQHILSNGFLENVGCWHQDSLCLGRPYWLRIMAKLIYYLVNGPRIGVFRGDR